MPEQKYGTATRRPDLGMMVYEFIEDSALAGFIWPKLFPPFFTAFKEKTFGVVPIEALLKVFETARAPKATYAHADYVTEAGKYSTQERGWEELLDDGDRELYDSLMPGFAEQMAVLRGNLIINRREEVRASTIMAALTAATVSVCWDLPATAAPLTDISAAKIAYRAQCGMLPNALVLTWTEIQRLLRTAQVIDQIKYTYPGIAIAQITLPQIAGLFDIPQVIMAASVKDTKGENIDTSIGDIWSNNRAYLTRLPVNPNNLEEPCLGHTFVWSADTPEVPTVEQYRREENRSDVFRCRLHTDMKLLQSESDAGVAVSEIGKSVTYAIDGLQT